MDEVRGLPERVRPRLILCKMISEMILDIFLSRKSIWLRMAEAVRVCSGGGKRQGEMISVSLI